MNPFPHHYLVDAVAAVTGDVSISAPSIPVLATAAPTEFGGPGGRWSPETLFVAAAVDCFVLTFRAIAEASKLPWVRLACSGDGTLDRVDGVTRFSALSLHAELVLPTGGGAERATRLLEKAERSCLVTTSLAVRPTLTSKVEVGHSSVHDLGRA